MFLNYESHTACPSSEELHLMVVEQALANSVAREIKMQKTLSLLTNSFQLLTELVQTHIPLCTSPKVPSMDIIPVWSTPTRQPLSLVLPDEFHGDWIKGQTFLTSCKTYICLCPDSFSLDKIKIAWALSYMKSGRAGKHEFLNGKKIMRDTPNSWIGMNSEWNSGRISAPSTLTW